MGIPPIKPGDDLANVIGDALDRAELGLQPRDVLVLAQKIVSKAVGRYVNLAEVDPSPEAVRLGAAIGKYPRLVHVILSESVRVVRKRPNLLLTHHRLGFVMANGSLPAEAGAGAGAGAGALLVTRSISVP